MLVLRWAILFLGLLNLGDVARADSKYIRHDAKNRQVIVFVHGVMGNSVDTWTNGETKVFWPNLISGLLPIEWVIFRNLDVMAVFDDDTLANR
jgi:hypothetical protein